MTYDFVDKAVAWTEIAIKNDEIARLRKGIQDYLDGNYPNPRHARARGPQETCPHGRHYWDACDSCVDEHFTKLLAVTRPTREGAGDVDGSQR